MSFAVVIICRGHSNRCVVVDYVVVHSVVVDSVVRQYNSVV